MSYVIVRPAGGIFLNGLESCCDENGNTLLFETEQAARAYLKSKGYTDEDMETEGIGVIEDELGR